MNDNLTTKYVINSGTGSICVTAQPGSAIYFSLDNRDMNAPAILVSETLTHQRNWLACKKITAGNREGDPVEITPLLGPAYEIHCKGGTLFIPKSLHYESEGLHIFNTSGPFVIREEPIVSFVSLAELHASFWRIDNKFLHVVWNKDTDQMNFRSLSFAHAQETLEYMLNSNYWKPLDDYRALLPIARRSELPEVHGRSSIQVHCRQAIIKGAEWAAAEYYVSVDDQEMPGMVLAATRCGFNIGHIRLITKQQRDDEVSAAAKEGYLIAAQEIAA